MKWLYFILLSSTLCSSCRQPSCPEPQGNLGAVPEIKINSCADTSPSLQLSSCVLSLFKGINMLLYARDNPYDGVSYNLTHPGMSCPLPQRWNEYEVIYKKNNFHLLVPVDECGSNGITPHATHLLLSHFLDSETGFNIYNANLDFSFEYYSYCVPASQYKSVSEFDASQRFSFYYINANGDMTDVPVKNILSVKSVSLDCSYINNSPASYSSRVGFVNSSYGIKVELLVNDLPGFSPGNETIDAYIRNTGQNGDFSPWTSHVFWKTSL